MRNTLLASAALLGMAMALSAFAQTATDPNPANPSAVKDGTPAAGTGSGAAPGNDPATSGKTGATLGSRAPQSDPGPLGNTVNPAPSDNSGSGMSAPAPSQDSGSSMAAPNSSGDSSQTTTTDTPARPRHHRMSSTAGSGGEGHWAHQPGTGESGPASSQASNIDSADTHSAIAPHLPKPMVGENAGPDGYLRAADRALAAHKTGAAQQALEMAETRLLDRSTEAGSASQPDQDPRIAAVTAARKSLAAKDWQGARKSIQEAMNSSGDAAGSSGAVSSGSATAAPTGSAPAGASSGQMQNGVTSTSTDTSNVTVAAPDTGHNAADGHPGVNPAPLAGSNNGSRGAAGVNAPGAPYAPNPVNPGNEAK